LIGKILPRASFARRLVTRAVVVLGLVWLGAFAARSVPHEQTLIFPVGSLFPNATRFGASWTRVDDREPRGGITLNFNAPPPLQIRQHTSLPNGDYIVSIEVRAAKVADYQTSEPISQNEAGAQSSTGGRRVETNIVRRVTLSGGETSIALAAGGF
jgi:hypothetical protein